MRFGVLALAGLLALPAAAAAQNDGTFAAELRTHWRMQHRTPPDRRVRTRSE